MQSNYIAPIVGVKRSCDDDDEGDDDGDDYFYKKCIRKKKYNGNRKRRSSIYFIFKLPNAICWMLMITNMIVDRWSQLIILTVAKSALNSQIYFMQALAFLSAFRHVMGHLRMKAKVISFQMTDICYVLAWLLLQMPNFIV